jgi:hypothetical protein
VDADELLERATRATGLADLGPDSYREGLEVLTYSLDHEADLNSPGRQTIEGQLTSLLMDRLQVEDWYQRHPEIDEQAIIAPIFGLGLPRTGSTALGNLFGEDPSMRCLRMWEASKPCPPPESATEHTDPRIAICQARLDGMHQLLPTLKAMVPLSATGPSECLQLLAMDFRSGTFEGMARVPSYSKWLMECDMVPAYRYHQRVLKLLQWRCPPQKWWLRTPAHMNAIDALDEVYPDARFVMTHREIGSVIPSVACLMNTLTSMATDTPDPHYYGALTMVSWETALRRTMAFRAAGREERFHDISHRAVQADPLGSMRRLYNSLGETLSPVAAERMAAWWAANAEHREPGPRYRAEDYGLDVEELRRRFSFYSEECDID